MSYDIVPDYSVSYVLPPCVEDWVPQDHPVRFIREFVDSIDLGEIGFHVAKKRTGAPRYSANLLVKVWLYGWFEKIYSFRGLENACRQHIGLIWLTGQHYPDHNTLWRFWKDNQKPLRSLFKRSVEIAWQIDLIGVALHAVDGTKVMAASSRRGAWHRADLEKLLAQADEQIRTMSDALERYDQQAAQAPYQLSEKLTSVKALRQRVQGALDQLDSAGARQLHPKEPEACMMETPGRREWAYNAQAVADEASGLIVAADVTSSGSDSGQLMPMMESVKENLGCVAQCTVADGGYVNGDQLDKAEQAGYDVVVNISTPGLDKTYDQSNFSYDERNDQWICPQKHRLHFLAEVNKNQVTYRRYGGAPCKTCPVHQLCTKQPRRRLEISEHHKHFAVQRGKLEQVGYADALSRRKQIIEPRFGWIKQAFGLRRWTVRGLQKVKTQWMTICTIWNLRRIWRLLWITPAQLAPNNPLNLHLSLLELLNALIWRSPLILVLPLSNYRLS
jgi:transposase